jgi:4-aminobutyrate aminotransferase-like enzyme
MLNAQAHEDILRRFAGFKAANGYDMLDELSRYDFEDVTTPAASLNRGRDYAGTAFGSSEAGASARARAQARRVLIATTLRQSAPVVHIDRPVAGHYLSAPSGVVFDAYIGVAQRLIDGNHPRYRAMLQELERTGALLRREAATNDVLVADERHGPVTPQALADQMTGLANRAFPGRAAFRAYLCSSGAEAIEAAIKLAFLAAHRRLVSHFGSEIEQRLMETLEIPALDLEHPEDRERLYADYPFYIISAAGGFHGRTLGALSLSSVRPVNKRGFPSFERVARVPFNGSPHGVAELIDRRGIDELLAMPGALRETLRAGRIPRDLVAGLVIEVFQGEAGYRLGESTWIRSVTDTCRELEIPVIVDEIQTFARTGEVFATQHYGFEPDMLAISKAAVIGALLASDELSRPAPLGWHSSTWGGGKIFDNTYAWTTIDTYLNYRDETFAGATYLENQRVKGEYVRAIFEWLVERHPETIRDARGLGGMWGFTVRDRDLVCASAREIGLKLLTCGVTEEWSSIRALFLADALTKEVNCFARLLDYTLLCVEHRLNQS